MQNVVYQWRHMIFYLFSYILYIFLKLFSFSIWKIIPRHCGFLNLCSNFILNSFASSLLHFKKTFESGQRLELCYILLTYKKIKFIPYTLFLNEESTKYLWYSCAVPFLLLGACLEIDFVVYIFLVVSLCLLDMCTYTCCRKWGIISENFSYTYSYVLTLRT